MITLKEAYKKTNQELIELVDTERLPIVFKEDFEEKKRAILKIEQCKRFKNFDLLG